MAALAQCLRMWKDEAAKQQRNDEEKQGDDESGGLWGILVSQQISYRALVTLLFAFIKAQDLVCILDVSGCFTVLCRWHSKQLTCICCWYKFPVCAAWQLLRFIVRLISRKSPVQVAPNQFVCYCMYGRKYLLAA